MYESKILNLVYIISVFRWRLNTEVAIWQPRTRLIISSYGAFFILSHEHNSMAKRFGDTDIWKKQRWFRKLSPTYKLAFLYIKDQCDHAGIWNIDCTDLVEDLGIESFDIDDFILRINTEFDKITGKVIHKERIRKLDKGYVWVTGFVQFQYKGKEGLVNPYAAPVKTALQILSGFKLLDCHL